MAGDKGTQSRSHIIPQSQSRDIRKKNVEFVTNECLLRGRIMTTIMTVSKLLGSVNFKERQESEDATSA
jgi:hypothetical protein